MITKRIAQTSISIAVLFIASSIALPAKAGDHMPGKVITVESTGEYANIKVQPSKDAIDKLMKGSDADRDEIKKEVLAHSDQYNPVVLCVLSSLLFAQGQKEAAGFWFYAGQLRSRADGNICTDVSARSATGVLTQQFGPEVNQYMMKDIPKLKEVVPKVIAWDKQTPHNYDRRWIALHGMGAIIGGMEEGKTKQKQPGLNIPQTKWDETDETTRQTYMSGFNQAMEMLQKERKDK